MPSRKKLKLAPGPNQRTITSMLPVKDGQSSDILDISTPNPTSVTDETENVVDMTEDKELKDDPSSEVRKFQRQWLQLHHWLQYDPKENKMYCKLCIESKLTNAMTRGTQNFKTSTLTRHISSADHSRAVEAPKQRKDLKTTVEKALTKEEEAVVVAMKAVFFLVQEDLPLSKYTNLINFLKHLNTPYVEHLQVNDRVDYTSPYVASEILKSLSKVVDSQITEKINASPVLTILTDESTDIVVHHKLCISCRIVDPVSLQPSTYFLTDVRLEKGTGKGIYDQIKLELKVRNISTRVMGLGTDGASTMTGTKEGLTGQFLRDNPHVVNTHCVAHRLALCTEQSAKKVTAMAEYQRTLEMLYYHFKKSPNKMDKLEVIQKLLEEPRLRYREVHEVRWLSFYEALDAVYRTLDSLLSYLSTASGSDPAAAGIKKRVGQELFISITYSMMDILQPIMKLCLLFQKRDLDIGLVQLSVDECVNALVNIRDDKNPLAKPMFLDKLPEDLHNGVFKGHHQVSKLKTSTQFTNVKRDFINAVLDNISKRFPESQLMTHLSVLGLRPISFLSDSELHDWGNDSIQHLADYYGKAKEHTYKDPETNTTKTSKSEAMIDPVGLLEEWLKLKSLVKIQCYPRKSLAALWNIIAEYHREEFPNLMLLAALALTHPVHTSDCERAFSAQNLVTTSLRNRLGSETCDQLMRVKLESNEMKEFHFTAALLEWRKVKDRVIFRKTSEEK